MYSKVDGEQRKGIVPVYYILRLCRLRALWCLQLTACADFPVYDWSLKSATRQGILKSFRKSIYRSALHDIQYRCGLLLCSVLVVRVVSDGFKCFVVVVYSCLERFVCRQYITSTSFQTFFGGREIPKLERARGCLQRIDLI